jgi:hypothetical protein
VGWEEAVIEPWRSAGRQFRFGVLLIGIGLLAFVPSGIAIGMLMNNQAPGLFGWASLICYALGVVLIVVGNFLRVQAFRRFRG